MTKNKIVLLIVVSIIALACTVSCEAQKEIKIEDYVWEMAVVLKNGEAVLVIEENAEGYPDAEIASWRLSAEEGVLILKNMTDERELTGSYSPTSLFKNDDKIYDVDLFYEGEEFASVAYTVYADGTERPTLIISRPGTEGYAAYFYAVKE